MLRIIQKLRFEDIGYFSLFCIYQCAKTQHTRNRIPNNRATKGLKSVVGLNANPPCHSPSFLAFGQTRAASAADGLQQHPAIDKSSAHKATKQDVIVTDSPCTEFIRLFNLARSPYLSGRDCRNEAFRSIQCCQALLQASDFCAALNVLFLQSLYINVTWTLLYCHIPLAYNSARATAL